jgi:hypothetical protein
MRWLGWRGRRRALLSWILAALLASSEGGDAGLGFASAPWDAAPAVPGAQVLERTPPLVVVLHSAWLTRARRHQLAPSSLDRGLLVGRDDLIAPAKRLAPQNPALSGLESLVVSIRY